jgi:predicted transposase YbfD/YdcC
MATSIWEHFHILPDPRVERAKLHKLEDILTIAICAVICGAETWMDIADFGKAKQAWLRSFLELPHGIASSDTFGRLFAVLDPRGFERCFQSWIADLGHGSILGGSLKRSAPPEPA